MFFILSKLLYFLLSPESWLVLVLLASFLAKGSQLRKRLRIAALLIGLAFSNPWLYRTANKWWQPDRTILPANAQYSAGILLGGLSMYDKSDTGYFGNNADRFIQTVNLYHSRQIKKIVISGGSGNLLLQEPAETDFLYKELLRNGIPKEDILVESKSRNTYENAVLSKRLLDSLQIPGPYIIVTSAQHMPRAIQVFRKAGYQQPLPYPCDYKVIDTRFNLNDLIIPDITYISDWKYLIKEMVGLVVYRLTGKA